MIRLVPALALLAAAPAADVWMVGNAELFAPGIASTANSEVRLTISPDGRVALWFSRDRAGGPGGYDIWMARRTASGWSQAAPVAFNSPGRDFDPAFSRDGRFVFFSSDRPGGLGGDDIWRVAVTRAGFDTPVNLGSAVNSAGKEWAPMLSPDGSKLLFSSDRPGGAGNQDLYVADAAPHGFAPATRLAGPLNTNGYEFDATFLRDNRTIVYARAPDIAKDRIELYVATPRSGRYDRGHALPAGVNGTGDTYGPMLDWSAPGTLTFSSRRDGAKGMDLYRIRYRMGR